MTNILLFSYKPTNKFIIMALIFNDYNRTYTRMDYYFLYRPVVNECKNNI